MKKTIVILISILIIFFTFQYVNECKLLSHFKTKNCFSIYQLKRDVGNKLSDYSTLQKIMRKINKTIFPNIKDLDNLQPKPELTSITPNLYNKEFKEIPFIKGLSNKEFIEKDVSISKDDNYEYKKWQRSHGGNWNTKFQSGKKINKENINKLNLAWKYTSINKKDLEKEWENYVQTNPIHINGKLIIVTPDNKVVAINAENGKMIWEIKTQFVINSRGILAEYDEKEGLEYLYVPISETIYKINAISGKVVTKFGKLGFVKAFSKVAPIVYNEKLVIVGVKSIFIFNKNTGVFNAKIDIHPKNKTFSKGAVWGGVAADIKKGFLYVTTGNANPHFFNPKQIGSDDNKRANSIVAIDINKKKIIWDFQEISHDVWDLDISSPPIIHNLKIKDIIYETVITVTKAGNTIILERNTGKPIFDINYRAAPKSKIKGIVTSPYQIFLKKPERFSEIEYKIEDIDKLSREKQIEIMNVLKDSNYGWFETPSFEKQLVYKGLHGGGTWMGAAIDPINHKLYISANDIPWIIEPTIMSSEVDTKFPEEIKINYDLYVRKCSSCHGLNRNGKTVLKKTQLISYLPSIVGHYIDPKKGLEKMNSLEKIEKKHKELNLSLKEFKSIQKLFKWWDKKIEKNGEIYVSAYSYQFYTKDGLPATNPPWGYIAKLDLISGKILYKLPVGDLSVNGKNTKIGTMSFAGMALNGAGILFSTGTEDLKAYAFDSKTGEELWSYKMDATGSAPPTIFESNGKQYVSFLATGGTWHLNSQKGSTLYTFSISD